MTSPFSWSDTVKIAFISCLPCLKPDSGHRSEHEDQQPHNPAINRIPRARPDELQGLLADTDTDIDAETHSLHSNPGRGRRNNKKIRTKKHNKPHRITFLGYNLFGRPIQLPDDDDALYHTRDGSLTPNTIVTAHSTATFDSDAAPLDSDTIAALSSSNTAAMQASVDAEAQRLKEKEERRQRRRERKELKRLIESRGIVGDGDEFEGFQGSGGLMAPSLHKDHSPTPNATFLGSDSGSGSAFSGSTQEEYGRFVAAPSPYVPQEEDERGEADLDGGVYVHKIRRRRGSHGGSDSRSRTSTSMSDRGLHQAPSNSLDGVVEIQAPLPHPQPGRKKNFSRISTTTGSSTNSHSPSLPSPSLPNEVVNTVEQGQGISATGEPVGSSIPNDIKKPAGEFPTPRLGGGEFPMTGFRGSTGVGAKRARDLGAFLARRGDKDEISGL